MAHFVVMGVHGSYPCYFLILFISHIITVGSYGSYHCYGCLICHMLLCVFVAHIVSMGIAISYRLLLRVMAVDVPSSYGCYRGSGEVCKCSTMVQ